MEKLNVYLSSGWFNKSQDEICTRLENYLRSKENINPYFPRHDGVKLKPGEFHDPKLREKVFLDNVTNIDKADFIITNLDGRDGFLDTGTVWEDGYATARGIPIIAYQEEGGKLQDLIGAVSDSFVKVCTGLKELDEVVSTMSKRKELVEYAYDTEGTKVLYIAPDNTEDIIKKSTDVASVLVECFGNDFRWVDKLSNTSLGSSAGVLFKDVSFMVAVIDDRHPIVSWMMGQCFARHIPMISYTNYDYGVNLMLALSILQHIKGVDSLRDMMQVIKRDGLSSIKVYDNSDLKVF